MQVICKDHNICEYRYECSHAKSHEIITGSLDHTENCTLLCHKKIYVIKPNSCFCDVIYTRKDKLKRLNGSNL